MEGPHRREYDSGGSVFTMAMCRVEVLFVPIDRPLSSMYVALLPVPRG